MTERRNDLLVDVIEGAVAGAIATWAMGKVTTYLYEHEPKPVREAEDAARGGESAYETAARKGAHVVGAELSKDEKERYGTAIHWALGIGAGAVYGALRGRLPDVGLARGLLYGAAFWLLIDEGANAALGLTPGPRAFPWQAHARGLAGHGVFGAVAEAALAAL
jgi:hypothetical protein